MMYAEENEKATSEETYAEEDAAEGVSYGAKASSTVYDEGAWDNQIKKPWPQELHKFGSRQNQFNRGTSARLRTLEVENRTLKLQVEQLQKELEASKVREQKSFGRVALMLDKMQAELDRVRLSAQLNSNAIDRIVKGPDAETPETPEQEAKKA